VIPEGRGAQRRVIPQPANSRRYPPPIGRGPSSVSATTERDNARRVSLSARTACRGPVAVCSEPWIARTPGGRPRWEAPAGSADRYALSIATWWPCALNFPAVQHPEGDSRGARRAAPSNPSAGSEISLLPRRRYRLNALRLNEWAYHYAPCTGCTTPRFVSL
jgi:hypothetical protein